MEAGKKVQKRRGLSIFSTETPMFCVGVGCLVYGFSNGISLMPIFFGVCIVLGMIALHFVRKKDWDAHWAEQEMVRREYEARTAAKEEKEGRL